LFALVESAISKPGLWEDEASGLICECRRQCYRDSDHRFNRRCRRQLDRQLEV
jgi:hypothetical protein